MAEARWTAQPARLTPLIVPALGLLAGLAAAGALFALSLLPALIVLAGLTAAVFCLAVPPLGLYLLAGLLIGQWPGEVIKLAGIGVCGIGLLWTLTKRRPLLPPDTVFLAQALLVVLIWVSALQLGIGTRVRLDTPTAFTSYLMLTWTFWVFTVSRTIFLRLIGVLLASGVVTALIGYVQYVRPFVWIASAAQVAQGNRLVASSSIEGAVYRIESITSTPDYLGMSMQILIPFAIFWALHQPTRMRQLVLLGAAAFMAGAMLLSFTRGVLVTTFVAMIPLITLRIGWRRTLPYLVAGVGLVLVLSVGWDTLRERITTSVTEITQRDTTGAAGWRVAVLPLGLQMFFDNFFTGVGIGQHRTLWRIYAPSYLFTPGTEELLPIHNAYLIVAIDLGIVGLTLFVAIIALAWRRLRQLVAVFRARGDQRLLATTHAAEVALVAMAVNNFMYPIFDTFRYFWVLIAVIVALGRLGDPAMAAEGASDE